MNLADFLRVREERRAKATPPFDKCLSCNRSKPMCYCHLVEGFESDPQFVILIHPIEHKRRVASGRMAHCCLKNSMLLRGADFSRNEKLDRLLADPSKHCVVLYPGLNSLNLSPLTFEERRRQLEPDKQLVLIVIDGTWGTANKMLASNEIISKLPRVCFSPRQPSNFRIRKQPKPQCVSTIEAIHECIELLSQGAATASAPRKHDNLLSVFQQVIDLHIELNPRMQAKELR